MRLKKSSSGMVGPRGSPSGGGQRWSSILEDWAERTRGRGPGLGGPAEQRPRDNPKARAVGQ